MHYTGQWMILLLWCMPVEPDVISRWYHNMKSIVIWDELLAPRNCYCVSGTHPVKFCFWSKHLEVRSILVQHAFCSRLTKIGTSLYHYVGEAQISIDDWLYHIPCAPKPLRDVLQAIDALAIIETGMMLKGTVKTFGAQLGLLLVLLVAICIQCP